MRLPTEAEWEHAARGPNNTKFPWGDEFDGWKCANSVGFNIFGGMKPVGSYAPNAYGLYDMSGNVYNFCSDWYETLHTGIATDPKGAKIGNTDPPIKTDPKGNTYVLRGADWDDDNPESFRSSSRINYDPLRAPIVFNMVGGWHHYSVHLGFRCVSGP